MKILVVDDEQLLVKGMKFNLENEGYTVETGLRWQRPPSTWRKAAGSTSSSSI